MNFQLIRAHRRDCARRRRLPDPPPAPVRPELVPLENIDVLGLPETERSYVRHVATGRNWPEAVFLAEILNGSDLEALRSCHRGTEAIRCAPDPTNIVARLPNIHAYTASWLVEVATERGCDVRRVITEAVTAWRLNYFMTPPPARA